MSGVAWVTGAVICGVVWGGFLLLLRRAMKMEATKPQRSDGGTVE